MKPQEMEAIPQAFESKMRELQLRIMEDIVRRLRKNAGEVTAAAAWQMKRAYELGVSKQALRQLLEQVAAELETQVDEVYDSKLANVYSADRQRYKAVGKPFIEYAENKELQQLISAVKAQTKDEFRNITQSMGFALPSGEGGKIEFHPLADYYQQTLDGAVMDIASGAFDYNTVLKRITNEMTNSGVRTVAYASGHTDRIEVAARRAVMTGFHQVVAKKAEQDMAALDTNYVEVTWHRGARPTHQVWQGKVYFWDRGFEDSLAEPPETLDNSAKSGIIDEKITYRMMNIYDEDALNPYTSEEIEKELQSSSIGRYVSHHIEYDGYSITMNYDENAPYNLCGRIHNKDIIIFPINNNDALEISETIIHEFAHEHFGWKYTQEHEVNCRIYEYLHSHNTISENQISQIVEFVKKEYSDFPEGDLYGY